MEELAKELGEEVQPIEKTFVEKLRDSFGADPEAAPHPSSRRHFARSPSMVSVFVIPSWPLRNGASGACPA